MVKTKRFGKLTTLDLPPDLREKLIKASGEMGWRPRTLEKVFAGLEAQIIFAKKHNDFAQWRACEDIGNKIRDWISADPDRENKYLEDCEFSSKKDEDPYFYR